MKIGLSKLRVNLPGQEQGCDVIALPRQGIEGRFTVIDPKGNGADGDPWNGICDRRRPQSGYLYGRHGEAIAAPAI